MQTIEAIVETSGNVRLLKKPKIAKRSRALVTILDEEPKRSSNGSHGKQLVAAFQNASQLDVFKNIDDPAMWQRKLRDEWE